MFYIIGSGPTGVATAKILLSKGFAVTMLDGGIGLEKQRENKLVSLDKNNPKNWDPAIIDSFKEGVSSDPKGMQKKLIYGSDFPYQEVENHLPFIGTNIGSFTPTLAQGGFSNVWGSAVLPYSEKDIKDWPIKVSDLEKYYQSVMSFLPLSSEEDGLLKVFPTYSKDKQRLTPSKQAKYLLQKMQKNKEIFKKNNLFFGSSRLAVTSGENASNCLYCGLCLYGCPKSIIYSTTSTLKELMLERNFRYLPGFIVTKVEEEKKIVKILGYQRTNKESFLLEGDKVYLAAGVVSSARIILNSKSSFNKVLTLKASEYFLVPMFSKKRIADVEKERMHTLSQVFIECFDSNISEHTVHMQLYTYSDLYKKALNKMFSWAKPVFGLIEAQILGRMLAMQGYLHSNNSSTIELSFDGKKLQMKGIINPLAKLRIKKLITKLNRLNRFTDLIFIKPMLQVGLPGEGRHVGGSFPMSLNPSDLETDLLGRPFSWENIHLVDASVFPNVPAPTITFTAMANAQRIADLSTE